MQKLTQQSVANLDTRIEIPTYDRNRIKRGIVHLGIGGFHRSHQARYTEEALASGDESWGISGVGILAEDRHMRDALVSQDFLYTLMEKSIESTNLRVVGSIVDYVYGGESSVGVVKAIGREETRIVSLTVTASGYCYNPGTRELDLANKGIIHDLKHPDTPVTVIGCLAQALELIRISGRNPPTIMSCDNIPHNGDVLKKLVQDFCCERNKDLLAFVEREVLFPNTMVDRITPVTTQSLRKELETEYSLIDSCPVFSEGFRQWIIEDTFSMGHPDWTIGGAQLVGDVFPYERMKIRLLNGAHMALSHVAYLCGYLQVDEAMCDPDIRAFITGFLSAVRGTVGSVPGIDLSEYSKSLIERFENPVLSDQVIRLTTDASSRMPNMLLDSLADLLEAGDQAKHIAFANAAWIRFSEGIDERGNPIQVNDRQADSLRDAARVPGNNSGPFLALKGVFPQSVCVNKTYVRQVNEYLSEIRKYGTQSALRKLVSTWRQFDE